MFPNSLVHKAVSQNRQSLETMNFSHKKRKIPTETIVQHHEETGETEALWQV